MHIQSTSISIILCLIINSTIAARDNSFEKNINLPDACKTGFQKGNWKDCANNLSTFIWNMHTWYDDQFMSICELKCKRKLKGRISNFQWVWDAKFECAERAPGIIGEGRGFKVRQNAMEQAVAQTIERSITAGKLTPNDFLC